MNVLFSGGDNWYPAIIGSKAVSQTLKTVFLRVRLSLCPPILIFYQHGYFTTISWQNRLKIILPIYCISGYFRVELIFAIFASDYKTRK